MPTPLPSPDATNLHPPSAAEVEHLARGVFTAIGPDGGPSELQRVLITAAFDAMTGFRPGESSEPIGSEAFAQGLVDRNEAFRVRILQTMILGALVLRPLPDEVAARVEAFARAMSVDDAMLGVARQFARGQLGLAAIDFERNGYTADWAPERAAALRTNTQLDDAWQQAVDDPALAARWSGLEHLPADSLGRKVWEFYQARGFHFPGQPGSAPPLLAQHDWVHVLADYGSRVESELEVFAFIARANDDPRGFSLLAMVVSLFETGYLATGAGLFEAFPGQLSGDGMAQRLADALRRGALSHGLDAQPDVDFLALDWFSLADQPLGELRDRFGIVPKSDQAISAGSVGPWQPGGISPFQYDTGRTMAADNGRPYLAYGATP
jgi:hypothetical protein